MARNGKTATNGAEVPRAHLNRRALMVGSELVHRSSEQKFTVDGFAEDLSDGTVIVILRSCGTDFDRVYVAPAAYLVDEYWQYVGI